ncbi:MAG: MOSC domain-containing protein [Albidovulum sp.]|jgi:hypothetical protein
MPELQPTKHYGTVVWLGRNAAAAKLLSASSVTKLDLGFAGIAGEAHEGVTRRSCSRVSGQFPEGTEIRNTRQLTILSAEEIEAMAALMGLEALDPSLLGANMVVRGIPDFTHVPPASRLQSAAGTSIAIDRINLPCLYPAKAVEQAHHGFGKAFKPAANGRRGVTAWIEREGPVQIGDKLRLHIPNQRPWQGADPAQG